MPGELSGKAAIVGIGATEFSKDSGPQRAAAGGRGGAGRARRCGLTPADVDGLVTFTMDTNPEIAVARATRDRRADVLLPDPPRRRRGLRHGSAGGDGGGDRRRRRGRRYRGFNERSGIRFGQVQMRLVENADSTGVDNAFSYPHGLSTPAAQVAMLARRYMHEYGATSEDFGRGRRWPTASTPRPTRRRASTGSRSRSRTTRPRGGSSSRCTCSTAARRATAPWRSSSPRPSGPATCKHRPAIIAAAAQGASADQYSMISYYRGPRVCPRWVLVGRQLWQQSGPGPTTSRPRSSTTTSRRSCSIQLEELGFCGRGEAKDFIADGAIELGGRLPLNTHGGQLGEAYIHGMNGIAEGVRQVRGTSVNQVDDVEHVLVTAGTGVPTSGLILG